MGPMSAKTTGCPKCGAWFTEVRYHAPSDMLRKWCERCGYRWEEVPLTRVGDWRERHSMVRWGCS
jgi:C4-type Zn-finger protein